MIKSGQFAELAESVLEKPGRYRWIAFREGENAVRDEIAAYVDRAKAQLEAEQDKASSKTVREREAAQRETATARKRALRDATAELDRFAERLIVAAPTPGFLGVRVGGKETRLRLLTLAEEMKQHAKQVRGSHPQQHRQVGRPGRSSELWPKQ
jgi:hypothetical protein